MSTRHAHGFRSRLPSTWAEGTTRLEGVPWTVCALRGSRAGHVDAAKPLTLGLTLCCVCVNVWHACGTQVQRPKRGRASESGQQASGSQGTTAGIAAHGVAAGLGNRWGCRRGAATGPGARRGRSRSAAAVAAAGGLAQQPRHRLWQQQLSGQRTAVFLARIEAPWPLCWDAARAIPRCNWAHVGMRGLLAEQLSLPTVLLAMLPCLLGAFRQEVESGMSSICERTDSCGHGMAFECCVVQSGAKSGCCSLYLLSTIVCWPQRSAWVL